MLTLRCIVGRNSEKKGAPVAAAFCWDTSDPIAQEHSSGVQFAASPATPASSSCTCKSDSARLIGLGQHHSSALPSVHASAVHCL
jgi:hypothetical protein